MADRQMELADLYPDEYVVLLGAHVVAHTKDKDEAYAHHDACEGDEEPMVIAPGALRLLPPPVVRGRALSRASGGRR